MSDETQYLPADPDLPHYRGRPLHDQTQVLPPVPDEPPATRAARRAMEPSEGRDARRRRNGLVLVAAAAVVFVVGVALALSGLRGGSGDDGAAPAAQQAAGAGAPQDPAAPAELVMFRSPTANIGCSLSTQGARCDIARKSWQPPPKPESCQGDWGVGVRVGPTGAELVCAGDTVLGEGDALTYGQSLERGDFRCTSSRNGMRCENGDGQGFTIARAAYRTF